MNRTLGFALGLLTMATSAFGQTVLVNSFETPADLANIVTRSSQTSQTTLGVTDGKYALRIDFGAASWPVVGLMSPTPADWSEYGGIAFDVSNISSTALPLEFMMYDVPTYHGSANDWAGGYTVPAGQAATLYMPFTSTTPNPMTYGMKVLPLPVRNGAVIGWGPSTGFELSNIYSLAFTTAGTAYKQSMTVDNIRLTPPFTASSLDGIIDPYGQFSQWSWPGKLVSTADFSTRARQEAVQLAANTGPADRDKWGGWADGPKSTATGYFHTAQVNGKWWLVDPSGYLFFSAGVDCVDGTDAGNATFVQDRTAMFQSLPAPGAAYGGHYVTSTAFEGPVGTGTAYSFYTANVERKYGPNYMASWRSTTTARLKSWGFNTLGNWSDTNYCLTDSVPYTVPLAYPDNHAHVSTSLTVWTPMDDAFDPKFATDVASGISSMITPYKKDPYCIGYFVDNEQSWTGSGTNANYGLAIGALSLNASSSPAKTAFIAELEAKYGTIAKFNSAWGTKFTAWSQLNSPYTVPSTLNSPMQADMGAFVLAFAQQYFRIVSSEIKKLDPNHLYLGCRFSYYTPQTVQAAAQYCDVVSFNYYAASLASGNWGFLSTMGKPALMSEFNSGATDRGPIASSLVNAGDQTTRGLLYQSYVESVLSNSAIVGCHWYQYIDQPISGRTWDGENFNCGLVDVTDTPYPELTSDVQELNAQIYTLRGGSPKVK